MDKYYLDVGYGLLAKAIATCIRIKFVINLHISFRILVL